LIRARALASAIAILSTAVLVALPRPTAADVPGSDFGGPPGSWVRIDGASPSRAGPIAVHFYLPKAASVTAVQITDITGRTTVLRDVEVPFNPGEYSILAEVGHDTASGVYFVSVRSSIGPLGWARWVLVK